MDLIIAVVSLAALVVFFVMATDLGKLVRSARNQEAILKRLLEIEKERDNTTKRAEQSGSVQAQTDQFAKYKAKI